MIDRSLLDGILHRLVDNGTLPMASAIVLRHGEEVFRGFCGMADVKKNIPVTDDTIYRIFSMTKVTTAVAMMQLYERGLFKLSDPVSAYRSDHRYRFRFRLLRHHPL